MYFIDYSSSLSHHGVKGMKWGVRNAETLARYQRDETSLKKGTEVASVSLTSDPKAYKNSGRPMYVYNPHDEHDSTVYKGPFSKYLLIYKGQRYGQYQVYEHRYKTLKDFKMPTQKQRIDEFKNLYNDKKFNKNMIRTMKYTQLSMKQYNVGTEEQRSINLKKLKSDNDYKIAYAIFNHSMEAAHAFKSTREYVNRMSSKYDAMVDDNNKDVYNKARDPIIIFRAQNVLEEIGSAKVSQDEVVNNTELIRKKTGDVLL